MPAAGEVLAAVLGQDEHLGVLVAHHVLLVQDQVLEVLPVRVVRLSSRGWNDFKNILDVHLFLRRIPSHPPNAKKTRLNL